MVGVVVAVQAQRLAQRRRVVGVPLGADEALPVRAPARRCGAGGRAAPCRIGFTTRVWTGPNEGAVRVANTAGCPATVVGTPLPPTRPALISWYVSAR